MSNVTEHPTRARAKERCRHIFLSLGYPHKALVDFDILQQVLYAATDFEFDVTEEAIREVIELDQQYRAAREAFERAEQVVKN